MRVLLVSHTCQSSIEGQPKAEHLARIAGIELCVLVPDRWKHYGRWRAPDPKRQDANYTLHIGKVRCPWLGPAQFYLHWYPRLAELIESFRPDIIDLWEEPWGLVSAQACRLRNRLAPRALILSETEQNIERRLPPPFERFRSYTLANANWMIGRSDGALAVARARGYQGPATVVPNAVDLQLFKPMDKAECRSRLGLSGFVVGYIGRLVAEKGVEDLVAALDHCPADVSLAIAGDGPLLPALRRALSTSGKTKRVRFFGKVSARDLPVLINALDVLALPSRTTASWKEQFGRVIIEAQACAVPVVGSDSGAIPGVVADGGLIVPERSPTALAQTLCSLQSDPRLLQELAAAGLANVHAQYSWEMVARKMADIYQRMLERDTAPSSGSVAPPPSSEMGDLRSPPSAPAVGFTNSAPPAPAAASPLS